MKFSKLFSIGAVLFGVTLSAQAQAAPEAFCADGFRTVDLGPDGSLTARGFVGTLQTAKSTMKCRPERTIDGFGVWKTWFDSKIYSCRATDTKVRAYVTRTGVLTTLQMTNAFGFLIFNGACNVKRAPLL